MNIIAVSKEGKMGVPLVERNPSEEDVERMEEDSEEENSCEFDTSEDDQPFDTAPLKIDWLDVSCYGLPGQLGIGDIPGCRFGEVWRKLKPDIEDLVKQHMTDMFLLCSETELIRYRVPNILEEYTQAGFCIHHCPIKDASSPEIDQVLKTLHLLRDSLSSGKKVLLHCHGGLGRSCLVAACLLLQLDPGIAPEAAIGRLRDLRGHSAIQTVKQFNFVNDFRKLAGNSQESTEATGEQRSVSR